VQLKSIEVTLTLISQLKIHRVIPLEDLLKICKFSQSVQKDIILKSFQDSLTQGGVPEDYLDLHLEGIEDSDDFSTELSQHFENFQITEFEVCAVEIMFGL